MTLLSNDLDVVRFARRALPEPIGPVFLTNGADVTGVNPQFAWELVRPPFERCAFHMTVHDEHGPAQDLLVLVFPDHGPQYRFALGVVLWDHRIDCGRVSRWAIRVADDSDPDGTAGDWVEINPDDYPTPGFGRFTTDRDNEKAATGAAAFRALDLLTVINQPRLITYTPTPLGPQLQRRARKKGITLDYRTLHLPDGSATTHHRSVPSIGPRGTALHVVRGHFATYTADAPMFGQHVGTFWRKPTVRGSEDHGAVVKDYATPRTTTEKEKTA